MNIRMSPQYSLLALVAWIASASPEDLNWYRGNTHVHGTVEGWPQERICSWYREHGYDFIAQTEHEKIVDASSCNVDNKFLVIPGQEITQWVRDEKHPDGVRHVHVNGIGMRTAILPLQNAAPPLSKKDGEVTYEIFREWAMKTGPDITPLQSYLRNLAEIRKQGGVPQVNHPNLNWSVRPGDLLSLPGPYLLEIINGYPFSNNLGGVSNSGEVGLSAEALWDVLLSAGNVVWGAAADDSHDYAAFDMKNAMTPGKGWIVVRAASLTPAAINRSLLAGQFYASNGIELKDVRADEHSLAISIDYLPEAVAIFRPSARFRTMFIGRHGRILHEAHGVAVSYSFRGDEQYVRAVIMDSDGRKAWTQPVFLDGRDRLLSFQPSASEEADSRAHATP